VEAERGRAGSGKAGERRRAADVADAGDGGRRAGGFAVRVSGAVPRLAKLARGQRDLGIGDAQQHDLGPRARVASQRSLHFNVRGAQRARQRGAEPAGADDRHARGGVAGGFCGL
jgi:hypothetical protein